MALNRINEKNEEIEKLKLENEKLKKNQEIEFFKNERISALNRINEKNDEIKKLKLENEKLRKNCNVSRSGLFDTFGVFCIWLHCISICA